MIFHHRKETGMFHLDNIIFAKDLEIQKGRDISKQAMTADISLSTWQRLWIGAR